VDLVRHALAIDERRLDFKRVIWGGSYSQRKNEPGELEPFMQVWFAGNHSDIGGSYPESESRLSDISLSWMVEQATKCRYPLQLNHSQLALFPSAFGMQHCEVWRLENTFTRVWSRWIRWPSAPREIHHEAPLHPTVLARFSASAVQQCDKVKPYRPASLQNHYLVKEFFE
jgi:hypothetical protein